MRNFLIGLLFLAIVTSFGGIDAHFGRYGPRKMSFSCVVTGDILFINGLKDRSLKSKEIEEYNKYINDVEEYKIKMKEYQQLNFERCSYGGCCYGCGNITPIDGRNSTNTTQILQLPQFPKPPTFCSPEDVKVYVFEACRVQNDKVYVGMQYARDLTNLEMEAFRDYDRDLKEYWQNVTISHQQAPYGAQNWQVQQNTLNDQQSAFEMPILPQICTSIYV